MQTKIGTAPTGHNAFEYQEWRRLRVHHVCATLAERYFKVGAAGADWFTPDLAKTYAEMKKQLQWNERQDGPFYLVSNDQDKRHTWRDMERHQLKEPFTDRTTIPKGERGHISFNRLKQELPTAMRVPDCIQNPVEMVIGITKTEIHKRMARLPKVDSFVIAELVDDVFREKVTPELVQSCWEHGARAVRVFCGQLDQHVMTEIDGRQVKVLCTRGGWVPKCVCG